MDAGSISRKATLPVMPTLRAAFAGVFGRLGDFAALAAVPFAIGIAGDAFIRFDPGGAIAGVAEHAGVPAALGLILGIRFLTIFLPWAAFVAAWHQFALRGKRDSRGPVEFYAGTGEESIFRSDVFAVLFYSGSFIAVALVSLSILDFPPNIGRSRIGFDFTLLTLGVLVAVRLMLMVPAHAARHKTSVGTAWRQSRGIAWRLFGVLFLATLPFNLLYFAAMVFHSLVQSSGAASREFVALGWLLFAISRAANLFLGTGVLVAALCLSYQHAIRGRDQATAEVTTASYWFKHFVLPSILAALLALAAFWVAEFLDFGVSNQLLLCAAALTAPLIWKFYRLETQPPPMDRSARYTTPAQE